MCLRFVAGLTHLEHENYQQYFNKQQLDLQCKREPFSGFETCEASYFHQYLETKFNHIRYDGSDNVPILLFQLLYESQNTTLCQVLAQSINNHSLCLDGVSLSLFDWLCLSYCINNSNTTWNHLHLGDNISNQSLSVFIAGLTNNSLQTQCKRLEVKCEPILFHKLLQSSLLYNIQECYCGFDGGQYVPRILLQFLKFPQLKILHFIVYASCKPIVGIINYTELEKCIEMNSTIQEMRIEPYGMNEMSVIFCVHIIRGVTRNKTITSLTLYNQSLVCPRPLDNQNEVTLVNQVVELLKDNNTLQALSLHIDVPYSLKLSSLNVVEVNQPMTALRLERERLSRTNSKLMISLFLPHIKGLHCLLLLEPYPPHLLFLSHPSLHTLTLRLDTAESAIELFTILQTNTSLKALSVKIEERVYTSSMGTSLQDMLTQNQTLKYLEINNDKSNSYIPSSFLSFLTTGLRHNTSLQQLNVSIPLNDKSRTFINVISQKNNLTKLKIKFILILNESYNSCSWKEKEQIMTPLFYEQVLPAVTNMLQSHRTIRLLRIVCRNINNSLSQPNWIELVQHLYETIFIHPSLEYAAISTVYLHSSPLLENTFKDQKKTLIDRHRKEQPHKPLPIVHIKSTEL